MEGHINSIKDLLKDFYIDYENTKLDFIQNKIQEEYDEEQLNNIDEGYEDEDEDEYLDMDRDRYEDFYDSKYYEYNIEYDHQASSLVNKAIYDYLINNIKNIDDCKYIHNKLKEYTKKEYGYFLFLDFKFYENILKEKINTSSDFFYTFINCSVF